MLALLKTDAFNQLETAVKRNALLQLGFDPRYRTDKLDFYFAPLNVRAAKSLADLRVREGKFNISATELGERNSKCTGALYQFCRHLRSAERKGAILLIESQRCSYIRKCSVRFTR